MRRATVPGRATAGPLLSFSPIRSGGDDQTIAISAKDAVGSPQSVAITLQITPGAAAEFESRTDASQIADALGNLPRRHEHHRVVIAVIERRPPVVGGVHRRKGHSEIVAQGELHHPRRLQRSRYFPKLRGLRQAATGP